MKVLFAIFFALVSVNAFAVDGYFLSPSEIESDFGKLVITKKSAVTLAVAAADCGGETTSYNGTLTGRYAVLSFDADTKNRQELLYFVTNPEDHGSFTFKAAKITDGATPGTTCTVGGIVYYKYAINNILS